MSRFFHAQARRILRSYYVDRLSCRHQQQSDFSIEKYGEEITEKGECDESRKLSRLAEYAATLGFYIASVATLTGIANKQGLVPKRFGIFDLALLGIATHKLSRLVAKDRIMGIIRARLVTFIRNAGAGEVEEEPGEHGIQRGIGTLVSCPYCMGPWSATALAFGFLFASRISRFFEDILSGVAVSDFLHRAYVAAKKKT